MNFYKPVSNKPDFNSLEEEVIKFWTTNEIFKKSIELRKEASEFKFYEGPPTANGKPGVHHILTRTFKDLVCRYQTMRGKKVERNAGWDEHGLPVEIEVEKQQGFTNDRSKKEQIEELGIAEFNRLCTESTQKYINEWEKLTERMAYWVDFSKAYRTSDPKYIESVWSIVKKLNDKGLLYRGYKVVPWACDSGTVVSQAEVALGYKDVVDETAYVKFKLTDESAKTILGKINNFQATEEGLPPVYMLAWTTTPWTLPSNMALAVGPDINYVVCRKRENTASATNVRVRQEQNAWQTTPELWEKLKPLAQQKRKDPTEAEEKLWQVIRGKRLSNFKFRRQHSIDRFIVDFYCSEAQLVLEVDGEIHEYTKEEDSLRQEFLEDLGYRVLRFSNNEVLQKIDSVIDTIAATLETPPLTPPRNQGGEQNTSSLTPLSVDGEGLGVRPEHIILSEKRWKAVLGQAEWEVVGELNGRNLLLPEEASYCKLFASNEVSELGIRGAQFVVNDPESGTGIVHIAPAFGQDDFECYKANNVQEEIINAVNPNGTFNEQAPDFLRGQSIFNENKKTNQQEFTRINKIIIKHLDENGLLHKTEKYEHSYPHNWRTNNPLIYYLRPSWYVATSKIKDDLIAANQQVNWYPAHVKEGRFGQWLENNIDWSISRERFWGTPLPIWQNSKGDFQVIASFDELKSKLPNSNVSNNSSFQGGWEVNPHKPYIDEITWTDEKDEIWKRVPEVLDCWFDSGAMPVAAYGINPPENFVTADYICEAVDQTRGWFYTLLALAVGLSSGDNARPPYKNVLCLGHILDKDGQKMSKSKGNVINPWELFAKFGADPVRWFMVSACSAGNPIRFDEAGISEVMRRFILPLWNTYAFYVLYANLDEVSNEKLDNAPGELFERQVQPIDVWIIARLNETQRQVTDEYDQYEFSKATQLIEKFVDDLSNIWVRANRSRFWNTTVDNSPPYKAAGGYSVDLAAYRTLHTCLLSVCKLAAPFIPLLTENIYQNLKSIDAKESLHLTNWVIADETTELEEALIAEMTTAQEVINVGRALRQELKLKIRQPLSQVILSKSLKVEYFKDLIMSELNVKEVVFEESHEKVKLNTLITEELRAEGLARELIHSIQGLRKNSGLDVSDRIELFINFNGHQEIASLIHSQKDYVLGEVLSVSWKEGTINMNNKKIKLEGKEIEIGVVKV